MKIIVRQVGYLQRLYRDARSTEHKVVFITQYNYIILVHTVCFNKHRHYLHCISLPATEISPSTCCLVSVPQPLGRFFFFLIRGWTLL